jgi:perosamine synthetase
MTIADWATQVVPFRFPIRTKRREALEKHMEASGIQVRRFFCPMHWQPRLKQTPLQSLPVSEQLFEEGLCLPVHYQLSDDDVDYQIAVIKWFFA